MVVIFCESLGSMRKTKSTSKKANLIEKFTSEENKERHDEVTCK